MGSRHPSVAPYGTFPTRDGFLVVAVALDSSWKRFCTAVGRPELIDHPRLGKNAGRIAHREELESLLEQILCERTADEWVEIMDRHGVPASPINTIDKVVRLPQVLQQELVVDLPHPDIPELKTQGMAIKLSDTPGTVRRPPPKLGEHTDEVLRELGYSTEQVARLREAGAL
jgi:crotonobetainyl-CoA:carnitine CoA-transferase CaiB-like acyl-CoA transferase